MALPTRIPTRFRGICCAEVILINAARFHGWDALSWPQDQSTATPTAKETEMMDVFVLALGALFFAFGFAYAKICDRL